MKVPAAGNSICLICFPSCCFSSLLGIRFPHLFGQYSEAPLQGWRFFLGETLLCCLDDARCEGRTQRLSPRHSPLRPVIPSLRCLVLPGSCPCPLLLPLYLPLLLLLLLLVPAPASAPAPVPALVFPCRSGGYRHGADCIWSPCCCLPYVLDRAQCLACGLNLCNLFLHL